MKYDILDKPSEIARKIDSFSKDIEYFSIKYSQYINLYPNRYVAIYNKRLQGRDKDLKKLIKKLCNKNIPPEETYIRLLNNERKPILIL